MDSALTYSGEELRSHSMPADTKFPVDALTGEPEAGQNLSSIYCATESAPASPFGSTHAVGPAWHLRSTQHSRSCLMAGRGTWLRTGISPGLWNSRREEIEGISALLCAQVPRSRVAQGIDRRMDSAQDSAHGIPRSALPVIYSAQGSEAAVRTLLLTVGTDHPLSHYELSICSLSRQSTCHAVLVGAAMPAYKFLYPQA